MTDLWPAFNIRLLSCYLSSRMKLNEGAKIVIITNHMPQI
jgi:hypothetical protein